VKTSCVKGSLSLFDAVAMGTGVMTGARFPLAFAAGELVTAFSACRCVKVAGAHSSAGDTGKILHRACGQTTVPAGAEEPMALSNESLVARNSGIYALPTCGTDIDGILVPRVGVGLIVFAWGLGVPGNRSVGLLSTALAGVKIGGTALFGVAGPWASGLTFEASGGEITDPNRNVGRAPAPAARGGCTRQVLLTAIAPDAILLGAFGWLKWRSDPAIVALAVLAVAGDFPFERVVLARHPAHDERHGDHCGSEACRVGRSACAYWLSRVTRDAHPACFGQAHRGRRRRDGRHGAVRGRNCLPAGATT
jgi:hypothetical protein